MKIVRCDHTHAAAWDEYVATHCGGSFYHRYGWRRINESCFGHESAYLAAMDDGGIHGILPIVRIKSRLFGHIACSMPFVNYGGICARDEQIEAALIDEAKAVTDKWGVEYLEIRSRRSLGAALPQSQHKVSLHLDLDADSEKLWNAFKSGHRQEIRRAYKNGFTVKAGGAELLADFYGVLSESWRDLGTPLYPKRYFDAIAATFPDQFRVLVAYAGEVPAAAAFDGFSRGTVEGMWMGAKGPYRSRGVNYVLYWELVKHACERGFRRFHLGRSSVDSGGETFKKKWNAHTDQLYWTYLLRTRQMIPELNVSNPKYKLAIRAWQKLPLPVTRVVGPLVAKSIP